MKYQKTKNTVISKIPALLLILALCISLVMPVADMDVYAESEVNAVAAEEIKADSAAEDTKTDASGSEKETENTPAVTTITGYETSYNKRYNQELQIEADITPADGRDVYLQRYSSEEDQWITIMTASASPDNDPESLTEEDGAAHVTFSIPKEERQKTSSTWRIYIDAADEVSAATSDNITVITRNLESISLSARTACVYRIDGDGQGTMIFSKNSTTQVAQASTTKLMTAVLLLESGLIDSTTVVSAHAAATPYGSGKMAAGDVYNTKDLLYAMLLPSSNDAATAVAERVGGSEGAFVSMMNAKAAKLGFTQTHFRNPHGLDADGHYTTARELAELTAYAYTFPEIRDCWAIQYKAIKSLKKGRKWHLWSTNAIFGYVSNFLGGKTGTEDNAGCCFTGVYTFNGGTYVTVVLGSGYGFSRWSDTKKLHRYIQDYAQSHY